jgi:translation initiation factor 1A
MSSLKNLINSRYKDGFDLYLKDQDQVYGKVIQPLGGARFLVSCFDGISRICLVRGKFRNKKLLSNSESTRLFWIQKDDTVLVSLREFEPKKGDIIYKYTKPEVDYLYDKGHIPSEDDKNDIKFVNVSVEINID